jgi:hypothetical protein
MHIYTKMYCNYVCAKACAAPEKSPAAATLAMFKQQPYCQQMRHDDAVSG